MVVLLDDLRLLEQQVQQDKEVLVDLHQVQRATLEVVVAEQVLLEVLLVLVVTELLVL